MVVMAAVVLLLLLLLLLLICGFEPGSHARLNLLEKL